MGFTRSKVLSRLSKVAHGFGNKGTSGEVLLAEWEFNLSKFARLKQVHSDRIIVAGDDFWDDGLLRGDALISNLRRVGVVVSTADCVPILMCNRKTTVVAAIHAGWRGTAMGIVGKTLEALRDNFDVEAEDVVAAVGPSINICCYEVGEDVASIFTSRYGNCREYLFQAGDSKYILDLPGANRIALLEAGVREIEMTSICTKCNSEFCSYRRQGEGMGSQLSFIGLV